MAINYPLSLPTSIGIASITLTAQNAVAISQSPFTYAQQIVKHQGERWSASVSLPPMLRDNAEPWVAFILSLKGQSGTFLLGDPNCKVPQGSAKTTMGTPLVNGGSQTGPTLNIDGLPTSVTGYLKAGDYIQLGASTTATLHKVLTDVDTNSSGQAISLALARLGSCSGVVIAIRRLFNCLTDQSTVKLTCIRRRSTAQR